jgi:hypothetical protein
MNLIAGMGAHGLRPHEEKRIVFLDSTSRESSSDLAGNSCNLRTTPKRLAVLNGWYRIVSLLLRN